MLELALGPRPSGPRVGCLVNQCWSVWRIAGIQSAEEHQREFLTFRMAKSGAQTSFSCVEPLYSGRTAFKSMQHDLPFSGLMFRNCRFCVFINISTMAELLIF